MLEIQMSETSGSPIFEHSDFEFVSNFVLRISDLLYQEETAMWMRGLWGLALMVGGAAFALAYEMKYAIDAQGRKFDVFGLRFPSRVYDVYTNSTEIGYAWEYLHTYIEVGFWIAAMTGFAILIHSIVNSE